MGFLRVILIVFFSLFGAFANAQIRPPMEMPASMMPSMMPDPASVTQSPASIPSSMMPPSTMPPSMMIDPAAMAQSPASIPSSMMPSMMPPSRIPPSMMPSMMQDPATMAQPAMMMQSPIQEAPIQEVQIARDGTCSNQYEFFNQILTEVRNKNPDYIKNILDCLKLDRRLIFQVSLIDPSQFQYASDILKEDENFVYRLIKISPEVLKYASPKLLSDQSFMERSIYLSRDSLQYADSRLLNNKIFMKKMIIADSKNYIFASNRLKEMPEYAEIALRDNGLLLEFAPEKIKSDKKFVTIALKSNYAAMKFAREELKKDKALQKYTAEKSSIKSEKDLHKSLQKNYIDGSNKKNVGNVISGRMKFFSKSEIIDRNYITKWQKIYNYNGPMPSEKMRLISADSRNYPTAWKEDFRKYPGLVKKIESFFLNRQIDQNTIDSLSTTYLWKVKSNPQTLVFNLYLLRDSKDAELGSDFADITSLTAIVQKQKNTWQMSVVEVIFDSDVKVDLAYAQGHKSYDLWDLYVVNKDDRNPKILFRVEDKFADKFEIFEEQNNGKYQMVYSVDPASFVDEPEEEVKKRVGW